MALAIWTNPETGEDEFYDDGTGNAPTTGAAFTPSSDSTSGSATSDGDAGEWEARDWIKNSFETTGLQDSPLSDMWSDEYRTGSGAAARRLSETNTDGMPEAEKQEMSVIDRLTGALGKAYDKDPLKALEFGFKGLAGLYTANQAKKLQESQARSALEQISARAQVEKDAQDRYNASFSTGGQRTNTKKPLTRMDGSRVYGTNGKINRG